MNADVPLPQVPLTLTEALRGATQHYQAGRLADAETICRQILSSAPQHAGALHLLGVIISRAGDLDGAIKLVEQALSIQDDFVAAHLTLGHLRVSRGDLPAAIASFQRLTALRPENPANWYSLGIVQQTNKNTDDAIASFQKALALDPGYVEAHAKIAPLLRARGRLAEAMSSFAAAAAGHPNSAHYQNNFAAALMEAGRLEEAEAAFQRAIDLCPNGAAYHANIGNFFMKSYSYDKALQAYAKAISLDPRMAKGYAGRGTTLAQMNRFDEAVADHHKALSLAPNEPKMHVSMAWVLVQMGQAAAAESHCRAALQLDSESANAWHTLGVALRVAGRFDEATACFNRSVQLCPNAAVYMLLSAARQDVDAGEADRLLAFSRRPGLSVHDRTCTEFALGKLLDNSNRFDEAFAHYKIGNELVKDFWNQRGIRFKLSEFIQTVSAMKQTFTPEFLSAIRDWGGQTQLPVFIVGMPRSGTTLVEQIAASHSQVFGAGELSDISSSWTDLGRTPGPDGRYTLQREQVQRVAGEYEKKIQSLGGSAVRVIDKMPENIIYLGVIATLFPNARVIFCQRDPRDNCLSCYFQMFARDTQIFSYDLADCGQRYVEQMKLQAHWQQVLPLRMMTIQYEQLVADLEGQSRRLMEFLDLPWEPRCLDFHKTDRTVLTASAWQVRQPIYTRSVGRWKHYEKQLGPLLEALGER